MGGCAVSYSAPSGSATRILPADLNHVNALLPPGVDLVLQSGIGIFGIHLRARYGECSRITGLGDIAPKVLRPRLFEHRDLVNRRHMENGTDRDAVRVRLRIADHVRPVAAPGRSRESSRWTGGVAAAGSTSHGQRKHQPQTLILHF